MIFPYWEDLSESVPRVLPLVPITLHGPRESVDLLALVDSGAEHNVVPSELARDLDVALDGAEAVTIVGAGEHEAPGNLVQCGCQLRRRRWLAPFIFVDVPVRPVLGQIGFFAFFTVTFRYVKRQINTRWTG